MSTSKSSPQTSKVNSTLIPRTSSDNTTGYVRTYIVFPSAVYGLASGPIFSAGLANRQSRLIPWVTKAAIAHGSMGVFGEGTNVWPWVHIDDTADMYMTLFDVLLENPKGPGHGWEGFYFCETGPLRSGDVAKTIAKALAQLGKIESPAEVLAPWTDDDINKYFGGVS
jgi:nucleoside-diphosphate-sugar epimerase